MELSENIKEMIKSKMQPIFDMQLTFMYDLCSQALINVPEGSDETKQLFVKNIIDSMSANTKHALDMQCNAAKSFFNKEKRNG